MIIIFLYTLLIQYLSIHLLLICLSCFHQLILHSSASLVFICFILCSSAYIVFMCILCSCAYLVIMCSYEYLVFICYSCVHLLILCSTGHILFIWLSIYNFVYVHLFICTSDHNLSIIIRASLSNSSLRPRTRS